MMYATVKPMKVMAFTIIYMRVSMRIEVDSITRRYEKKRNHVINTATTLM